MKSETRMKYAHFVKKKRWKEQDFVKACFEKEEEKELKKEGGLVSQFHRQPYMNKVISSTWFFQFTNPPIQEHNRFHEFTKKKTWKKTIAAAGGAFLLDTLLEKISADRIAENLTWCWKFCPPKFCLKR